MVAPRPLKRCLLHAVVSTMEDVRSTLMDEGQDWYVQCEAVSVSEWRCQKGNFFSGGGPVFWWLWH